MRFLHLSRYFWPNANCSSCLRFEGCLFQLLPKTSIRFRSWYISHFRVVWCFSDIVGCFYLCVLVHCPAARPMTCDWDQVFWHWPMHFSLESLYSLDFITPHGFKTPCARCSKAAPKHNRASPMFHSRKVCSWYDHFSTCEHRADVHWQEVVFLSHLFIEHSPRSFVACQHLVWKIPVWLFFDLFSTMVSSLVVSH